MLKVDAIETYVSESKYQIPERLALELMIKNARISFRRALQSTKSKILFLGSFNGQSHVVNDFLRNRLPDVDLRKKLSKENESLRSRLTSFSSEAKVYAQWTRKQSFGPIWDEALISYCTAFEACLKSIAIAFKIGQNQSQRLKYQVLIPSSDVTKTRRIVSYEWQKEVDDVPKCQDFYGRFIKNNLCIESFSDIEPITQETWDICGVAFQLRNFIIHNLSIAPSTVELGKKTFHAGSKVDLAFGDIRDIEKAFELVLKPFSNDFEDYLDDLSD